MSWTAVIRLAKGTLHQKLQMPCQDYGNYYLIDNAIAAAVADGAGSAKFADLGAKLAVETLLQFLQQEMRSHPQKLGKNSQISLDFARHLFQQGLAEVLTQLENVATKQGSELNEFACTLLAFVATPDWMAAMQIGDGFIVMRSLDHPYQLLFQPDKGEYLNETSFVTSMTVAQAMQVQVISPVPQFICAATDGLERVAIQWQTLTPFAPFFEPLKDCINESNSLAEKEKYLQDFLNSDRLNRRTDDDKTLLLCAFHPE